MHDSLRAVLKCESQSNVLSQYRVRSRGGVIGPTQRPCVYLLVEGTTWSPRNRSMKGIFKELFNILSSFKSQICVYILPGVYHIFIVMINQMAKSFGDMSKIKIEHYDTKTGCPHNSFVYTFKMVILIIQNISNIICHFTLIE